VADVLASFERGKHSQTFMWHKMATGENHSVLHRQFAGKRVIFKMNPKQPLFSGVLKCCQTYPVQNNVIFSSKYGHLPSDSAPSHQLKT
jgi:hypothetical protein